MIMTEKQSEDSQILLVHQKAVNARQVSKKKFHLPSHIESRSSSKKLLHFRLNIHSSHKQCMDKAKAEMSVVQTRNWQQQKQRCLFKNHSQWKNRQDEQNPNDNYPIYKKDEKMNTYLVHSNDFRRPMPNSLTLPLKSKQSEHPSQQRIKQVTCDENEKKADKQSLFTMNRKQLRKRKKGSKKNNGFNCRVVNLFESLKEKINSIRQHQTNTIMGMNLKEYLEKVSRSCYKFADHQNSMSLTVHTETPSKGPIDNKNNQQSPESSIIFKPYRKQKQNHDCQQEDIRKQFDLKPWSTQEIAIGF